MSPQRGIAILIEAMSLVKEPIRLNLVGSFPVSDHEKAIKKLEGLEKINFLGTKNRTEVSDILTNSFAGVVTFLPLENHINAQPNKLFEYFSVGIPVICSNFQLWRDIIDVKKSGICVDPQNPEEIKDAIEYLYDKQEIVGYEMGLNGQNSFLTDFNWSIEEEKLHEAYSKLSSLQ